ncbi:hypothetical protein D5S17_35525 [Pseudonocardiaceae bacterium YIM PH 21723]|nr:hypothetical protein D5S17_35525 [Pseudonocardiaceae bacterium YIM PH 21723]
MPERLAELRARAAEQTPRFADPARLQRVAARVSAHYEWATAVLGHEAELRRMDSTEVVLLDLAAAAEPDPPVRPRSPRPGEPGYEPTAAELAEIERRRALGAAWAELKKALPVAVQVAYNYSGGLHLATYLSGAHHILLQGDLVAGRIRRSEHQALCQTPSRSKQMIFHPGPESSQGPPNCKACIETAYKITDLAPAEVLLNNTRHPARRLASALSGAGDGR